jgi:3-dehydroquinate synthase
VGAFYQPRLILSDVSTLRSLDTRQIRSGLAEAIKYGVIKDKFLFAYLEKNYRDLLKLQPRKMEFVIYRCSRIKARIIEQDEKEKKGIRTILNFGHTIGHAIEAASGFKKYTHGEAIALGMLAAASISTRLGLIPEELSLRIRKLIAAVGLPVKLNKVSLPKIIKAHYRDKKFIADINRFVLIKGLGRAIIRKGIALKIIQEALKELS